MVNKDFQQIFMKLFSTNDMSVVKFCQEMFNMILPSDVIKQILMKFEAVCNSDNSDEVNGFC